MINIDISIDSLGLINRFTVEGHSDFGAYGKDIVCAAVSVLAQTAIIALNQVCDIDEKEMEFIIDEEKGYLELNLSGDLKLCQMDKAQTVLRTFEVGIKSIIESYPKYVTLNYREV